MATTLIQAQAYEAKIQAAQATVKEIREGVYSVRSSRKGVQPHIVTVDENGVANFCTCEHFEHNGWERDGHKCYHAQAVTRYCEAQEAVKAAEHIVAEPQEVTCCICTTRLPLSEAHAVKHTVFEKTGFYKCSECAAATNSRKAFFTQTPEQAQIDAWVRQGVDRVTATRVATAKPAKSVARGTLNASNGFSLYR